ncbi:MerR family transcriptional regulator [Sporosarcina siberiensis]|uniref:MerR family transcriptional regulator n=1 Tax=Sporosarcina siberiensis TaxID=1365606 RepID=A0ABW4SD27_9BACL
MNTINRTFDNENYSIQQVSDMTGLSKQVIRKWEERHEIVQPKRLDNGYRTYSKKDVNVLLSVKTLADQGLSIKQAATLVIQENANVEKTIKQVPIQQIDDLNNHVFQLIEKGTHCDEVEINLVLQQAFHQHGLSNFLTSVVVPFLQEIGKRWEKGEWDAFQESISSMVVRDFLVQIRRNFKYRENAPLVLGACLPNEQHEIPVQILLLQLMQLGWRTLLVGSSPAPGSLESIVDKLKPVKVLLSASTTIPFEMNPLLLKEIDDFAYKNKHIDICLGGYGAVSYSKGQTLKALRIVQSIEDVVENRTT